MYGSACPPYPPSMPDMYGHHNGHHPHLQHQHSAQYHPQITMHPRPPYAMQHGDPSSPNLDMYPNHMMKFNYPPNGPMHYPPPHHQPCQPPPPQLPPPQLQQPPIELLKGQHSVDISTTMNHQVTTTYNNNMPAYSCHNTKAYSHAQTTNPQQADSAPVMTTSRQTSTPDFTASETSFTGIGTSFDTPKAKPTLKQKLKPRPEFFCELCNLDLLKKETYDNHCDGQLHKANEKKNGSAAKTASEEPKPKVIKDLREKYPDQYCDVCDTTMTSDIVFQQHLQGLRHQKNVRYRAKGGPIIRGRGSRRLPLEQQAAEKNIRCQKLLDSAEEPLIGLQFMTEYTKNNPHVEERYVCDICNGKCDPRTLMPHIVGAKHRYSYIKFQHPELFEPHAEEFKGMRKAEKTLLMAELAAAVAEKEGEPQRMKAKVEIDPFYNPNKDKKTAQAQAPPAEAQKRPQDSSKDAAGAPPAKRAPKAKVTPNWGGPDPCKLQQRLDELNVEQSIQTALSENKSANTSLKPQTQTSPNTTKNLPKNLNEIMKNLSQCLVNNEHEASMALQVSNTLTQALLQYRLKNLTKEASESKTN